MARRRGAASAPRTGRRLRRWHVILLACLALLLGAAVVGWVWVTDRPSGNQEVVLLTVPKGATLSEVVRRAEAANVADQPFALSWVLRLSGTMDALQAGIFEVPGDAHALDLAEVLSRPPMAAAQMALTLIPGESVWEAARRMERAGVVGADELTTLAQDRSFAAQTLGLPVGAERATRADGVPSTYLEGFLYPETYFIADGATLRETVTRVTRQFRDAWRAVKAEAGPRYAALRRRHGLTEADFVTIASLVEEETAAPAEARRVAGVFYNRLAKKMRLETDPTLVYHPERVGRPPGPSDRRNRDNPYNTYAIRRLPPGPICSPSRRSLAAAINPEEHDFLFFAAKRDGTGEHAFAKTFEAHKENVQRYLR